MDELLGKLNIPEDCFVNNTIFKKLFYKNGNLTKQDKDIIANCVNKIVWLYSFKTENIGINSYKDDDREYEEVEVIQVILNEQSKYEKAAEIVQKSIPYPIILILKYEEEILLNAAYKKINKADNNKYTVEEFIYTDWLCESSDETYNLFESLNVKKLSYNNFFVFYSDMFKRIAAFNLSSCGIEYTSLNNKDLEKVKEAYDKIKTIEAEISDMKTKIKNEVYFNNKVELNVKIKKAEKRKLKIIDDINYI